MTVALLPEQLLEQAEHLARRERRRPKQASLRRATSTAYYALFHLLVQDALHQIGPNLESPIFNRTYRWFDHGTMYRVAKSFALPQVVFKTQNATHTLIANNPQELQSVAQLFTKLQDLRHSPDYDPGALFQRRETLQNIEILKGAFRSWPTLRSTSEANAFLLSLLLWDMWAKRL